MPARPARETLIRFFAARNPYGIGEAALLIGWTEPQLHADLAREGRLREDGLVAWEDVALRLLRAWPLDWLIRSLGRESATLLPAGLHPQPVTWRLPRYLILAIETQARLRAATDPEVHTSDAGDLLTDILHRNVEPATVELLRNHAGFLEAFHFPHPPGEDEG